MADHFSILVVCTGNIARSPMGERLLATALAHEASFRVTSAGTWGLVGRPMERAAALVLAEVGVDEGGFVARELSAAMVRDADLVLGATRQHRSVVLGHEPAALRRSFTLKEMARLVEVVPAESGESPADRAGRVVEAAAKARGAVRVSPRDDDIADPYGASLHVYRQRRDEIARATSAIAAALLGRRDAAPHVGAAAATTSAPPTVAPPDDHEDAP